MYELKRKLNARLTEMEAQLEAAVSKASSLEKTKHRLHGECKGQGGFRANG